jgi:hypothetical protein
MLIDLLATEAPFDAQRPTGKRGLGRALTGGRRGGTGLGLPALSLAQEFDERGHDGRLFLG